MKTELEKPVLICAVNTPEMYGAAITLMTEHRQTNFCLQMFSAGARLLDELNMINNPEELPHFIFAGKTVLHMQFADRYVANREYYERIR